MQLYDGNLITQIFNHMELNQILYLKYTLLLQFSKFFKILFFEIFSFDLFYSEGKCIKVFLSQQVLLKIIRFKITIYLMIKQNIFEFSSESKVHKNEQEKAQCVSWFIEKKSDIQAH